MKLYNKKYVSCLLLAALLVQQTACKKDYTDPSKAPKDNALASPNGLTGIAIGLQRVYTATRASSLYTLVTADGFVTNQLTILNQGNTDEYQLYQGGNKVFPDNVVVGGLWKASNKIIYDANNVIANAGKLDDKTYASGLIGYTTIFKALSIGNMAMLWDSIPRSIGVNAPFISQVEGYKLAVSVIDSALTVIAANPISSLFTSAIPQNPAPVNGPSIDIVTTLTALKARYALFAGNYAVALAAANAVDLTKKSTFNFDAVTLNSIYETAASNTNVYQPADSTMGLPPSIAPDLTDKREPFYISVSPKSVRFLISGFAATGSSSWPVYLPGEMTLIKAECYARQLDLPDAIIQLNVILTKKPANDPFGVGADLPPYAGAVTQDALLTQIYRNRAIELYMSGLRLEDMRRFGRPLSEFKRKYLPFPTVERNDNTNTPRDPDL